MGRRAKGKRSQHDDTAAAAVIVEDVNESSSSSDDDSSQSSSASSTSSSEDSPTPSGVNNDNRKYALDSAAPSNSKTWDSMDGYEVRQNALKLLKASPGANNNEIKTGSGGERKMNSITYQSYQDLSYNGSSTSMGRPSHFSSSQTSPYASSAQPNWGESRSNANDDDDSLSIYHVASLTFNCMVHCLTEGYRAASTYYNNSYPQDSTSSMGGFQNTSFEHVNVGSYQDNSYSDGQSQYREVMERGTSSQLRAPEGNVNGDRGSYQSEESQRGDWGAAVKVTYQGKR